MKNAVESNDANATNPAQERQAWDLPKSIATGTDLRDAAQNGSSETTDEDQDVDNNQNSVTESFTHNSEEGQAPDEMPEERGGHPVDARNKRSHANPLKFVDVFHGDTSDCHHTVEEADGCGGCLIKYLLQAHDHLQRAAALMTCIAPASASNLQQFNYELLRTVMNLETERIEQFKASSDFDHRGLPELLTLCI